MPVTSSLAALLSTIAEAHNKQDRLGLTLLLGSVSQQLAFDLPANLASLGEDRQRAETHISLVMALRTMWMLVPERLFSSADPRFEALARDALTQHLGEASEASVRQLSTIFRRLYSAKDGRFGVTGLDLNRPIHRELMRSQHDRCALCHYHFDDYLIQYAAEEAEDEMFEIVRASAEGEIALTKYHRRPVLDHIIPQFLGGDGRENWQILCQSCNAGKGDGLSWIMRRGLMPPSRPYDALQPGASVRFAVLSLYQSEVGGRGPGPQSNEIRLFRRDPTRLPVFDNLVARPGDRLAEV